MRRMRRRVFCFLVIACLAAAALAGCGNAKTKEEARSIISDTKARLADAAAKGVTVSTEVQKELSRAEGLVESKPKEALDIATKAKTDIDSEIEDAMRKVEQEYEVSRSAAQAAIAAAVQGADLTQAQQSLEKAEAKKQQAKTVQDYNDPNDGPIHWCNVAAQQATEASAARIAATQEAKEIPNIVEEDINQLHDLMVGYLESKNENPLDWRLGIQKISTINPAWCTGEAVKVQGASAGPMYFLFEEENDKWFLRAAPSWTAGQFGAPSDMVP